MATFLTNLLNLINLLKSPGDGSSRPGGGQKCAEMSENLRFSGHFWTFLTQVFGPGTGILAFLAKCHKIGKITGKGAERRLWRLSQQLSTSLGCLFLTFFDKMP